MVKSCRDCHLTYRCRRHRPACGCGPVLSISSFSCFPAALLLLEIPVPDPRTDRLPLILHATPNKRLSCARSLPLYLSLYCPPLSKDSLHRLLRWERQQEGARAEKQEVDQQAGGQSTGRSRETFAPVSIWHTHSLCPPLS